MSTTVIIKPVGKLTELLAEVRKLNHQYGDVPFIMDIDKQSGPLQFKLTVNKPLPAILASPRKDEPRFLRTWSMNRGESTLDFSVTQYEGEALRFRDKEHASKVLAAIQAFHPLFELVPVEANAK